jgi:predicted site-specific integrase-resolvase
MKNTYPPREFGLLIGRTTKTLQRWDRKGIFKAHRSITGRRYYTHDQYALMIGQKAKKRQLVTYCRVSSAGQKKDLISQRNAVESFCLASGKIIDEKLEDIGSGLNYKRKHFVQLMEMVERGEVSEIIVAHKDRLVRFGFEWFEKFCNDHGVSILVMNAESLSPEQEMTKDLLSIIHCFSSRLYGLRKYKKKILEMAKDHENC